MTEPVRIQGLCKAFDNLDDPAKPVLAVNQVNLDINEGELVTLLGPSGCGKTTLLRMVAGFEEPTEGDIFFGDRRMNNVPPNRRDATMVFQSYAIFPHLSIFENVAFGLRLKSQSRKKIEKHVTEVLAMTGLSGMANRSPTQLSGGQQQRVALARAIVMEPRVLLFDEPLSNLDAKLRDQMRIEIRELQQRLGITSLYVTHDQVEAMSISDRIVVMRGGVVEQVGTPREIYSQPANRFVAEFIGRANFITAKVGEANTVDLAGARIALDAPIAASPGDSVTLLVRPEVVTLSPTEGIINGTVRRVMFLGNLTEYLIEVPGTDPWLVELSGPEAPTFTAGDTVRLSLPPSSIHVLAE
ncbi:ABC transporter ATP-binding protein [Pararhodobacter oceanensis]|uniref:Polyamine ABC transporter ATP-binding protein n=1 Tax=Pararhodobacter oceanensis TaxID=2172121 RepID=A0A2T8HPP6_9RHOB|nr:ABC transporter ATP-binding protein [Pararhodobacter oceanensis]PVH27419.1 polyamine ABC transporter ATP-binding protein [Pararhodobacter oceanensis]